MRFKFSFVCELLSRLEDIVCHDPSYALQDRDERVFKATIAWFNSYRTLIDSLDASEASALLSTLLPNQRTDRIYGIQTPSLYKILGRCLGLSASKRQDLASYRGSGNGDLGSCLERILAQGGPPAMPPVSILEVDDFLHDLASQCKFSAPEIRREGDSSRERSGVLGSIVLRLYPKEAKWIVRLLLKDFSPVVLDETVVLRSFHFLLPDLLKVQYNFDASFAALKDLFKHYPSRPDPQSAIILRQTAAASFKPSPGIRISRSEFCKARSINSCLEMTAKRKWLVERKYDGEYCQIHIDLTKGDEWLKIYSKNGRDSTQDRKLIHDTIRKALRIGTSKCRFKRHCILVGEMVAYSLTEDCILSFDKIRKHVSRAGAFLGADQDSPVPQGEQLMIVFFDLLLVDDEILLPESIELRKARLSGLYRKISGRAMTAESTVVDFSEPQSKHRLMHHFAASIAARHEGLILKPCGVPYFPLSLAAENTQCGSNKFIKLKKDYISGLGDEADFAVIGASYDATEANKCPRLSNHWTHFHLACLLNEHEVRRYKAQPHFKVVATIAYDHCIPPVLLQKINCEGKIYAESSPSAFLVDGGERFSADIYFRRPFVFEVLGSSYCKPSNTNFFMLRHPRVTKLHGDRTWKDCVTFTGLQILAREALAVPVEAETQENLLWIERLEKSCKAKLARSSCNTTPRSNTTAPTPEFKSAHRRHGRYLELIPESSVDPPTSTLTVADKCVSGPSIVFTSAGIVKGHLPTPPGSSLLHHDVPDKGLAPQKRIFDAELEISRKRQCTAPSSSLLTLGSDFHRIQQPEAQCEKHEDNFERTSNPQSRRSGPLADVTKRVPQRMHTVSHRKLVESPSNQALKVSGLHGPWIDKTSARFTESMACRTERYRQSPSPEIPLCSLDEKVPSEQNIYFSSPFVVFLDPSNSSVSSRHRKALSIRGVTVVQDLVHWDRDAWAYDALSDTVSESQSYPGLRKVVLVDGKIPQHVLGAVARVQAMNHGQLRERVEFYDYDVVETLCDLDRSMREGEGPDRNWEMERYSVGAIIFDTDTKQSVFVPRTAGSSADQPTAE